MPYASDAELPEGAKKLDAKGRARFRAAFNACHKTLKDGEDESRCFRIAYAAARSSLHGGRHRDGR